jgi:hypothetical protein
MPTCGSWLAAAERERGRRWADSLLWSRAERKGRGERWTRLKEEAAVSAKRGEWSLREKV